jgi:hypothetical protein
MNPIWSTDFSKWSQNNPIGEWIIFSSTMILEPHAYPHAKEWDWIAYTHHVQKLAENGL